MIRSRKRLGRAEGEGSANSCNGAGEITQLSGNHYDFYWSERWSHTALRRSVLVSVCLHVAVMVSLSSARYRPKIIEFPPLYEVQLVELEPERRTPPKKPEKKPVVQPEKKAPKVATPPVEPKKEVKPKPPPEPVKQPAEEKREEVKPPARPPKVETEARIEADVPLWYVKAMEDTVDRNWEEPAATADAVLETIVYFKILGSGEVASPQIEKPSGDKRWDLAALRAVMESRFPPWPPEVKEVIGVHLKFKNEGTTTNQ